MKNYFLIGCSTLSLLYMIFFNPSSQKPDIKRAISMTVRVSLNGGHGTGVIVKSDQKGTLVLTNNHVCQMGKPPFAAFADRYLPFTIKIEGREYRGTVFKTTKDADLCLIQVSIIKFRPSADIGKIESVVGDKIYTVGNPYFASNLTSDGYVGEHFKIGQYDFQQAALTVYPGQSGSGVFTLDNHLVGLVTVSKNSAPSISGFVPLTEIKKFLKGVL